MRTLTEKFQRFESRERAKKEYVDQWIQACGSPVMKEQHTEGLRLRSDVVRTIADSALRLPAGWEWEPRVCRACGKCGRRRVAGLQ